MIETLVAISVCAFAGLCLTLVWPRVSASAHVLPRRPAATRPQPRRTLDRAVPATTRSPGSPRAPEELIRRSFAARDAFARELSPTTPSAQPVDA